MTLTLDCPKCGRRNILSEDDAVFFYPKFQCLSCGTKLDIPLSSQDYLKKLRDPDRDRRIDAGVSTSRPPGPVKVVPPTPAPGDAG